MLWWTLGSAAFIAAISGYLWRRREDTKGALTLSFVGLLLVVWSLAAAAEVAAVDVSMQRRWFVLRDALTLPGALLAFWFALQYAGLERWLTRPVAGLLIIVAVAHVALEFVDGGRLLWSSISWDKELQGDRTSLGILFGAFAIAMFLASTAVFALLFIRSPAHRMPVALILLGQVAVRVLYPIAVFNVVYVPSIVAGVVSFDVIASTYAVALFRFRLFDLVPVAHQTILAHMPDGLLVLDARSHLADLNVAAAAMLDLPPESSLRLPVATALAAQPDLARVIGDPSASSGEATIESPGGRRTCEVSTTPLADWQGRPIGRLVVLHDITALRGVEARLVEHERALAAAEERERLARELHDGLAQDLWLAKLKTGRLAALADLGEDARALTGEVGAAVEAGLVEAREAVAAMRLTSLEHADLAELLRRTLEDFEDRFGLRVEFECQANLPPLPPRVEAEVLRIAQEALTNVRRHADATVVRVRAALDGDRLVIEVRDNGLGFDAEAVGPGTYGLAGMRERAALIGGTLEVRSAPRKGTGVRLDVPIRTPVLAKAAS